MPKFNQEALRITATYICKDLNGDKPGFWHPRAQERWKDYLPEAEKLLERLYRYGLVIKPRAAIAKAESE